MTRPYVGLTDHELDDMDNELLERSEQLAATDHTSHSDITRARAAIRAERDARRGGPA